MDRLLQARVERQAPVHHFRRAGPLLLFLFIAAGTLLSVILSLNLLLAALNLLPFPPLDGSGALPLLLSDNATRRYQAFIWGNPGLSLLGILVAWQVFGKIFHPIFGVVVNLLYPGVRYS